MSNTEDDFAQRVDAIESGASVDLEAARKALRALLYGLSGDEEVGTVGEALTLLARRASEHRDVTPVILRFLNIPGLVPETNATNQIARSVVELAMGSLPELCDFLGVTRSKQTFENYATLRGAHERLCSLLAPLEKDVTTLDLFLSARHPIIQCLNHSAVQAYCAPFGLAAAIACAEQLFALVRRIKTSDPVDLQHQIRLFASLIDEYKLTRGRRSNFFVQTYFLRLLNAASATVDGFLAQTRSRFSSPIIPRLAEDNSIPKRYPLEEGREFIGTIPLRNNGPGTALNVKAQISYDSDAIIFAANSVNLGSVAAGDFSVSFEALVVTNRRKISTIMTVTWEEMGSLEAKSTIFDVEICAQKIGVPWEQLQYLHPYSTAVAKGNDFVGRQEKVATLASKILRTPMEPFFVTGQKRIGKTSLALAAAEFAKAQSPNIEYRYVLWGDIAHEDPRNSIDSLASKIVDFIQSSLPGSSSIPIFKYDASLAPALALVKAARELVPDKKFLLIVDEFDEIHPDLYLHGALAEAFFANLRALSNSDNVCVALVGGENMPFIMERQGQKLNKFIRFGLDYFSRLHEWQDFSHLIRRPTEASLNWHESAITAVFNATNGNPYFAKVVCANVYSRAIRERDSDVTAEEVKQAITAGVCELDTNSFVHLWQDGIFRVGAEREPVILQRCRVLVAVARTLRRGHPITLENLLANKHSSQLLAPHIAVIINDFVRREVLVDCDGHYEFVLPLFGLWLKDIGMVRLVSDALAQELAEAAQAEEDRAYVTSEEVSGLVKSWPTYRGKHIGTDDVRAWFEQVGSQKDQRLLFTILKNLTLFTEAEIREKLKLAFEFVRPKLPEFVIRKRSGRTDVVITYVDGEGKSGQFYASRFAEENQIPVRSILTPAKFSPLLQSHLARHESVAAVVVVDDIVATGGSLSRKLTRFIRDNEVQLRELNKPLFAIALAGTEAGVTRVIDAVDEFGWLNFELRICDPLLPKNFAFQEGNDLWSSVDDFERAKSLCRDLGVNIYQDAPLGYGDQGLLIAFPDTCPNNTLPIIHSAARADSTRKWTPLFPRITN